MKFHEETNFYEGYQLALQNAKDHIAVALAAEKISIGIANSHLILASEEAIKANLIFLFHIDKNRANKEIEDTDKYFHSHKHKHEVLRSLEFINIIMEIMLDTRLAPFLAAMDEDLTDGEFLEKKEEGTNNLISRLKNIASGKEKLKTNSDWWRQADNNKNVGFYVSHVEKSGKWKEPNNITNKQLQKSKNIVLKLVNDVEFMCSFLSSEEGKMMYKEFSEEMDKRKEEE